MRPYRLFVSEIELQKRKLKIEKDLFRHMVKVLRVKPGSLLNLITPQAEVTGSVEKWEGQTLFFKVEHSVDITPQQGPSLTLAQCLPKHDKFSDILRGCTELGVSRFIPLVSQRTALLGPVSSTKQSRWQHILRSAAQQSQRMTIPVLESITSLNSLVDRSEYDLKLIFWEDETQCFLRSIFDPIQIPFGSILIVIGPEGGLMSEEVKSLAENGFVSVGLNMPILRVEHAGLVACAQILALCG